jgi:hypothetical protein
VGEIDAVGADVNVIGPLDHGADIAGGFTAEAACGYATAAETTLRILGISGRRGISLTSAIARPIGSGHRLLLPLRGPVRDPNTIVPLRQAPT